MNGVMYILSTGCQWRYLPKDFPPRSTVHNYFIWWHCDGVLDRIHHALYVECREQRNEKEAPPLASSIVEASRAPKKGPHRSARLRCRQADQGQEAAYSRRYAGSVAARHRSFRRHPGSRWRHRVAGNVVRSVSIPCEAVCRQRLSRADLRNALAKILPCLETEIVKRPDQAKGFVQLPKRWIVERTIAWLTRCRRLAKDWENLNRSALAFLKLASIRLMLRKLCNP